jgi:acrylyl-CoA reductase (NADPH)
VRLIGIDSVQCPMGPRLAAWARLARDLDRGLLASLTETVPFDRVFEIGEAILKGQVRGRVVVEIGL